tara:strand:- start:260 stop:904 length:645 start_codon:yes stop_codon:yes gene_type:complete
VNYAIATSILWPAEKFVNLLIERDSHVRKLLASFCGKSMEIETFLPKLHLTIKFYDSGIRLNGFETKLVGHPADVIVSGDFDRLLRLLIERETDGFFNQNIKVAGDAELAQKLYDTLLKIDIDWPSILTPWLGHVLTNELHKKGKKVIDWSSQLNDSLNRNLQDYVKEEKRLAPSSDRLESLKDDIDLLKLRVDRVMAKTQLLSERLNKPDVKQ